jgi:hypothetical protein
MPLDRKTVLILCITDPTRGEIISIVRAAGYPTLRLALNVEALKYLKDGGVPHIVPRIAIIGQHKNASVLKEWLEENCTGMPIIEVGVSELDQLPARIERLIGPP